MEYTHHPCHATCENPSPTCDVTQLQAGHCACPPGSFWNGTFCAQECMCTYTEQVARSECQVCACVDGQEECRLQCDLTDAVTTKLNKNLVKVQYAVTDLLVFRIVRRRDLFWIDQLPDVVAVCQAIRIVTSQIRTTVSFR